MLIAKLAAPLLTVVIQQTSLDTTIAVAPEVRLEVVASAGSIDVKVWDRSAVRIVARSSRGAVVRPSLHGTVLRVEGRTPTGGIDLIAYEVTVPRKMNLTLGRRDVDITVHGTEGAVDARITSGRMVIDGGRGVVSLRSFEGPIEVTGARASVTVESTMGPVTLTDVGGDIDVTSNSNHVSLVNIDTRNLRASSISGVIRFSGPLYPDGRYSLIAHSGSVFVRSHTPINATVSVATVDGAFASALPYTVTERQRKGIFIARFGNGGAQVTMESFTGGLVVEEIKP
jgi:DUF4097 and DUF4098 domain-containing protein YvlB